MYDFGHLIYDPKPRMKVDTFVNGSQNGEWLTWRKPAGSKFVHFFALGAGGSGGCSSNTVVANNAGGGGGGGGAPNGLLMPALLLPDILYIQVGLGGVPVVGSGLAGSNGGATFVCVDQNANAYSALVCGLGGGAGGAGNTTVVGAAGAAGPFSVATNAISHACLQGRGVFNSDSSLTNFGGLAGAAGSFGAATSVVAAGVNGASTSGAGGGGSGNNTATGFAGGSIVYSINTLGTGAVYGGEFYSNNVGGLAGHRGNDGWICTMQGQNLYYMGGSGGGGGNSSIAAAGGGNGTNGAGGGGAGGTYALNALATPGLGGDGLVTIVSFF